LLVSLDELGGCDGHGDGHGMAYIACMALLMILARVIEIMIAELLLLAKEGMNIMPHSCYINECLL
jgi:hypothetical protein